MTRHLWFPRPPAPEGTAVRPRQRPRSTTPGILHAARFLAPATMSGVIDVTHFSDPGCPWAYSAAPALTTLRWRYGDRLRRDARDDRPHRGRRALRRPRLHADALGARLRRLPPLRHAVPGRRRRRASARRRRPAARSSPRACTAPELEMRAFRALQFAQFTTTGVLEDRRDPARRARHRPRPRRGRDRRADRRPRRPRGLRGRPRPRPHRGRVADGVPGPRGEHRRRGALHGAVARLRERRPDAWRPAASSRSRPTTSSSRTSTRRSPRRAPALDALDVLAAFPYPLATAEVAAVMTEHLRTPDRRRRRGRADRGHRAPADAVRIPAGDDALWALAA